MNDQPTSPIRVDQTRPGVFLVTIDRPERRNALNLEVKRTLTGVIDDLDRRSEARVIVITGSKDYFVAGTDLSEMRTLTPTEHTLHDTDAMFTALRRCNTPLIAAIEGYALGGGLELALSCDLIVAGRNAKLGQPEIRVGVIPGAGGTHRLLRALGKYRALSLLLTGDTISGQDAHTLGLVSETVADGEAVSRALDVAEKILSMPPLAVRAIIELADTGMDLPLEAALLLERKSFQLLFDSDDQVEGMTAFLEKRRPVYSGR